MHGSMAIFNAWCDRQPVIVIGATGTVDATKRRPWIEWIHTSRDQASMVRHFVKWDDQPGSIGAARESILRAGWIAKTAPQGPTYVVLDVELQEKSAAEPLPPIDPKRYMPKVTYNCSPEDAKTAIALLQKAKNPLIMMGRCNRGEKEWANRVALAEALGARVITDSKVGAAFPTAHPLHVGATGSGSAADALAAIKDSDVILSLDWVDLAGTFKTAIGDKETGAKVIQVTLDHIIHNGWSMDYMGLATVDVAIAAETDNAVSAMVAALAGSPKKFTGGTPHALVTPELKAGAISVNQMVAALRQVVDGKKVSLLQIPLSWKIGRAHV